METTNYGEFGISGIKCDSCNFKNDSVSYENYANWVNKPCPDCGANLLTEEDMELCKALFAGFKTLNVKKVDSFTKPAPKGSTLIKISMNGSGTVSGIEIKN